jgi:hypothetical protein
MELPADTSPWDVRKKKRPAVARFFVSPIFPVVFKNRSHSPLTTDPSLKETPSRIG